MITEEDFDEILAFAETEGLEVSDEGQFFRIISDETPEEILLAAHNYFTGENRVFIKLFTNPILKKDGSKEYRSIKIPTTYEEFEDGRGN